MPEIDSTKKEDSILNLNIAPVMPFGILKWM